VSWLVLQMIGDLQQFNRYSKPITLDEYLDDFFADTSEGAGRTTVKRVTAKLREQLVQMTINAPDWYTSRYYAHQ
jgi:glycerol-3-phosphate O-acyltransferase / dihydroxyacetone phosphate acyltransferase